MAGRTPSSYPDHLNTPRLVADATGTTVWRWDQAEPFGVNVPDENPSGLGVFEFPARMEGKTYFDIETNLLYNTNRYRDTSIGRFPQADPLGLYGGQLSLYVLTKNNPLSVIDPFGLTDVRIENAMRAAGLPPPPPPTQLRCRVECQLMFYPFCGGAGFGIGLVFSAATPIVGVGTGMAVSGACNVLLIAPYCKSKCQQQPSCTPSPLPSIDPSAKPDDVIDMTF